MVFAVAEKRYVVNGNDLTVRILPETLAELLRELCVRVVLAFEHFGVVFRDTARRVP